MKLLIFMNDISFKHHFQINEEGNKATTKGRHKIAFILKPTWPNSGKQCICMACNQVWKQLKKAIGGSTAGS